MAWMFNEQNRNTKRKFMSFTECVINGDWDIVRITVENEAHRAFRALNEGNCEVEITTSDGNKWNLRFRNGGLISIEQSMLLFRVDDVVQQNRL
jgi:hypothetical protein